MASTSTNLSPNILDTNSFNCERHSSMITKKLLSFYEEHELFDTVLIAGNKCTRIQAHRVVLCALSEYFLEFFRGTKTVAKENIIIIELKEIKGSTLKSIIDFMYKGSIELSLKTINEFLRTASFLKIESLINCCCELIAKSMNCNNCLKWFRLANELSSTTLKAKSLEFIYSNFKQILMKNELLILNGSELKDLLFINNPHDDFEEDVFLSMVEWINFDKTTRDHLTLELLSMVDFKALTAKFIVENRKSVCKTVQSYELTDKWLQWHMSPETRSNDEPDYTSRPKKKQKKMPDKLGLICIKKSQIIIKTFNPQANSWTTEIEARSPTDTNFFSTIVIDNKLISVGRSTSISNTNNVECFDLDTLKWISFPQMDKSRKGCRLENMNRHLCAIETDHDNQKSIDLYNFSTQKWRHLELLLPLSRTAKIATHNEMLYILDLKNGNLKCYNIYSNKWTCTAIEKDSITGFGFTASDKYLYIIGGIEYITTTEGWEDDKHIQTVRRYDISNNSWSEMTPLPPSSSFYRFYIQAKLFNNKIIIWHGDDELLVEELNLDTQTWRTLGKWEGHGFCFFKPTYLK